MATLILTLAGFLAIMLVMAVGVIFKRPCLRGSCGGPEAVGPEGESLSCATCPNRKKNASRKSAESVADGGLRIVS